MEIRKGKLKNAEARKLIECGCLVKEYKVNGEDYTYIVHPVSPKKE